MRKIVMTAAFAAMACGAQAETLELETTQEALIADNNFGVTAQGLRQCNAGVTGQCYYPPGFGDANAPNPYRWDVCPVTTGMDQGQMQRANAAQQTVMNALRDGGADVGFGCPASGATPEIQILKGGNSLATCQPGTNCTSLNKWYFMAFCTVKQPLGESPSIPGSEHAYCYKWNVEVNYNHIDATFPAGLGRDQVYENVIGAALSAAIVGSGQHSVQSLNNYWSFDAVSPTAKHGLHPADFCRAAADYEGVDFFSIRKQDNSCD
jgi:hypothetical protein